MIKEEGIVEKVIKQKAIVSVQKSAACANCPSKSECEMLSERNMKIKVVNKLHAKAGDRVEISLPEKSLLKLATMVYFLPVIALIIGAYAGEKWAQFFHVPSTWASITGGGITMVITFYALKRIDKVQDDNSEQIPRMTRILSNASSLHQPGDNK